MRPVAYAVVAALTAGLLPCPLAASPAGAEPASLDHRLEFGGSVRVRGYALANMWDFDHGDDQDRWSTFRYRTRVFVRAEREDGIRAHVQVANQHWGTGVTTAVGEDGDLWEGDGQSAKPFVDEAYLDWPRPFGVPVEARLGRQYIFYGSGFVLADGQSQLASTADYLDGVRISGALGGTGSLDLFYFKDQENRIDDAVADDLNLAGAYFVRPDERLGGTEEIYALWREDQMLDRRIGLLGARVRHMVSNGLDYDIEAGIQRGDLPGDAKQEAWGVKTELAFSWQDAPIAPRPFVGFVALSGDDPATATTDERWDVFYGGWPQFGDLLAWACVNLGDGNLVAGRDAGYASGSSVFGEVVYSNLTLSTVGLELAPLSDWFIRISAARLGILESDGGSDHFGEYAQIVVRHQPTEDLTFAVYGAALVPGDAFRSGADTAHEIFWETNLSF